MGNLNEVMQQDVARKRYEAGEADMFESALIDEARRVVTARRVAASAAEIVAEAFQDGSSAIEIARKVEVLRLYAKWTEKIEEEWYEAARSLGNQTAMAMGPIHFLEEMEVNGKA